MAIHSIKGSLMEVAPKVVRSVALWASSGFNGSSVVWSFELFNKCDHIRSILPRAGHVLDAGFNKMFRPWYLEVDSLWRLEPKAYDMLEYIYVFANPTDAKRLENIDKIDELINRCFDSLKAYDIDSVAMIIIRAGEHTDDNDLASGRRMVQAIENWMAKNGEKDVYLVDRLGDFDRVMD